MSSRPADTFFYGINNDDNFDSSKDNLYIESVAGNVKRSNKDNKDIKEKKRESKRGAIKNINARNKFKIK